MLFKALLLLFFEVNLVFSVNGECEKNWENYSGHCYFIGKEKLSWFDAKKFCQNHNAYLATITCDKENEFLVQQFNLYGRDYYWLGGTDIEKEGVWTWESGERFAFSKWLPGQPDNSGGINHCLVVVKSATYNWDDGTCRNAFNFVCEKDEFQCSR